MKDFIKYTFATITGLFLTGFILGLLLFLTALSYVGDKKVEVKSNSVLEVKIDYDVPERSNDDFTLAFMNPEQSSHSTGLDKILKSIKDAKKDPKIKGIYLKTDINNTGFATLLEIRNALQDFKTSGKFIYSIAPHYEEKNYYLACVADSVFIQKSGLILFNGLSVNVVFLKGLLEKVGVEMQYTKAGAFKGAIEKYSRTDLSPENRLQITEQVNALFSVLVQGIGESRHIDTAKIASLFNNFSLKTPAMAVEAGLLDGIVYEDELHEIIKTKLKIEDKEEINFISASKYTSDKSDKKDSEDKIAIVYAVGEIVDGKGNQSVIGAEPMVKALKNAREDENVKAIVLRINSPGGSSFASDVIAREVALCKGIKPVVVSMGDVAASGGYYIAAMADTIIALQNTITGSIGVFGLFPNMQELLTNKLGLSFETVNTGKYSDFGRVDRPLSEEDRMFLQMHVDRIYDEFTGIVEKGRNLDSVYVESLAQGRVWSATQAKSLKLIDTYGGISDALAIASYMAKIKEYRTEAYPKIDNPFAKFLNDGTESLLDTRLKAKLGVLYPFVQILENIQNSNAIQMRMPFEIQIR